MCPCHWGDLLPFSIAQVIMIMTMMIFNFIIIIIIMVVMMDDDDDNDDYNGDLHSFRVAQVDKVAMKG